MAVFTGAVFFGSVYFTDGDAPVDAVVKTGTGGIDPGDGLRRRRPIIKPTGLLQLPKKEGRKDVADRIAESGDIQAEIAARLAKEFTEESLAIQARPPVAQMSLREVEAEIAELLQKKLMTEDDEMMILMLVAAAA